MLMTGNAPMMKIVLSLLLGSVVFANVGYADPPQGKGGGKNRDAEWRDEKGKGKGRDESATRDRERPKRSDARDNPSRDSSNNVSRHFEERHRNVVREYYATEFRYGHCPPGLAKKNNGCMPPGQAKKWRIGQPLPRDVIYYDLPSAVAVRIGTPPAGHRYVRVAADILLIAIGTGMVVDAIADLGSM
jgi:Ni/Co efflux regulator RcnB